MPCHYPCSKGHDKIFDEVGKDPMEILYQRRCANYIYVVPDGLRELMSDISREVIRTNPENINMFIADYLHTLMITRENAKIAIRLVENVGDTAELLADFMEHTELSRYQIDKSARIIQRTFRRLVQTRKYEDTAVIQEITTTKMIERLKVTLEEANKAATVIQHAYHSYKLRQERRYRAQEDPKLHIPFRHIDWLIAAQRTFDIFKNIRGVRMTEYNKAAIVIQAAYRGYYTRKLVKDYFILMKKEQVHLNPDDENVKQIKDLAARILQKFFRRIVAESKLKKRIKYSAFREKPSFCIDPEHLMEVDKIIENNNEFMNIEGLPEKELISIHATSSKDYEETCDRAARIIQRFFRRIVFQNKTRFTYETKYDTDEVDSEMYEVDTEIENFFEENYT